MAPHRAKQQYNCRGLPEALASGNINVRRTSAVRTTVAPYSKHSFSPRGIPESLAASSGTSGQERLALLGAAPCQHLAVENLPGADAEADRVRALASYKEFPHPLKRRRPRHPDPEGSQGRVRPCIKNPLSRQHSKHLPAFVRFPFLTREFDQVRIALAASRLMVPCDFAHRPERTVPG